MVWMSGPPGHEETTRAGEVGANSGNFIADRCSQTKAEKSTGPEQGGPYIGEFRAGRRVLLREVNILVLSRRK